MYDSWKKYEPVIKKHSYTVYKNFNSPAKTEKFIQNEYIYSSYKKNPK